MLMIMDCIRPVSDAVWSIYSLCRSAHAGYSQLVINGKILVKKAQDSGRLEIEGPLCEDFYTARSMMCGQYATL